MKIDPPSLIELQKTQKRIRNANVIHREAMTPLDHSAKWITEHVGTMGFFFIIFVWTVGWLSWNMFAPLELRFDPYPAFVLWLFISNMVQIFLMPLIMVGQNLQSRHAEARAEADFDVNIKAEKEIETILKHLETQQGAIAEILKKMEGK